MIAGLVAGFCMGTLVVLLNASYYHKFLGLLFFSLMVIGSYLLIGLVIGVIVNSILAIAIRNRKVSEAKKMGIPLGVAGITGIVYALVLMAHVSYYKILLSSVCLLVLSGISGVILVSSIFFLFFSFAQRQCLQVKHFLSILLSLYIIGLMAIVPYSRHRLHAGSQIINTDKKIKAKKINSRTLIIGIDSATWTVMLPMIEKGELNTIKKLMNQGAYGPLQSFIPTSTPVIWTSIATGKRPQHHGILDFVNFEVFGVKNCLKLLPKNPDFMRLKLFYHKLGFIQSTPVTSILRNGAALWNIIPKCGGRVGIIDWPVTFPAEPVNGFMVSDLFYHSSEARKSLNAVYPPSIRAGISSLIKGDGELRKEEVGRFIVPGLEKKRTSPYTLGINHTVYLKKFLAEDESTALSAVYLFKKEVLNLMAVYFEGLDPIQHLFWMYHEPGSFHGVSEDDIHHYGRCVKEYYRYMDEVIRKIITSVDFDTIAIISDHGMEAISWKKSLWVRLSGRQVRSGTHENAPDGIFIISGKNIKKNKKLNSVTPFDITPSILASMGLPIAEDMDGRVITEAFDDNFLRIHPIETVLSYDEQKGGAEDSKSSIDDEVRERLRTLGYIQ